MAVATTVLVCDLTAGPPLSNVGPGDYGLYVIARDRDCFVVGAQCDPITVTDDHTAAASITVPSFLGGGCVDEEICVNDTGECILPGTGGAGGSGGAIVDDCDDKADGALCDSGTTTGRCRSGSCCTGCWDGTSCHAGDSNIRCGVGGTSCALCECFTDVCETGADVYGPTEVPYGTTWDHVSVGDEFVLAVSEGWFWGWGYNNDGELGTGATGGTTHPGVTGFAGSAPEAGKDTACGLDVLGAARCWGANVRGQVGNGEASWADVTTPALVSGGHRFDHFALGDSFSCAVTTAGALYCWGYNRYEQLGVGQTFWDLSQSAEPMRVGSDSDWAKVSAGGDSACGLRENGTLWCWGRNQRGQLGLGDTDSRASPTRLCF